MFRFQRFEVNVLIWEFGRRRLLERRIEISLRIGFLFIVFLFFFLDWIFSLKISLRFFGNKEFSINLLVVFLLYFSNLLEFNAIIRCVRVLSTKWFGSVMALRLNPASLKVLWAFGSDSSWTKNFNHWKMVR